MATRILTINNNNFEISYIDESYKDDLSNLLHNPVSVYFYPNYPIQDLTDYEAGLIFNENEEEILNHIFEIINDNKVLYDQFDIKRELTGRSFSGGRNPLGNESTISYGKHLVMKFKD